MSFHLNNKGEKEFRVDKNPDMSDPFRGGYRPAVHVDLRQIGYGIGPMPTTADLDIEEERRRLMNDPNPPCRFCGGWTGQCGCSQNSSLSERDRRNALQAHKRAMAQAETEEIRKVNPAPMPWLFLLCCGASAGVAVMGVWALIVWATK